MHEYLTAAKPRARRAPAAPRGAGQGLDGTACALADAFAEFTLGFAWPGGLNDDGLCEVAPQSA